LDAPASLGERLARGDTSMFVELVEVLAEAVTVRDPNGDIVYANRAALAHLGFESVDELRGRSSRSIMDEYIVEDEHGRPLTLEDVPSMQMIQGQRPGPLLMRVVNRETGQLHWNLLKATAMHDEEGRYIGAMTVIEDVTAVKTAEIRTRALAESGRILASSLDYQQTLRNVVDIAVPSLVDYCSVDLVDERGRLERVAATHRDPARQELATQLSRIALASPEAEQLGSRVVATGTSVVYAEVTDQQLVQAARSEEHLRLLRELGLRSLMIVPMRVPTRTVGVMTLATADSRRRLTGEDVELAEQLGRRAAVAVENARLHTKLTDIAETLQRSLLPNELPEIDGWEVAALYRPTKTEQRIDVGGDFYELFEYEGSWFAIIGDVTGKGVEAASLTALMRHGARVASRSEPEPAAILNRLDDALRHQAGGALCSALCARLHPDHLVISSGGHPQAIVVSAGGGLREVPTPGPLLGAFADSTWPQDTVEVAVGDLVVLYTDGVIETPGPTGRFGIDRLKELLIEHCKAKPVEILERLDEALDAFGGNGSDDDVAVLVFRPRRGAG
jgi:PAS domain S-box-containing protein